jgi:hypothetical protein
MKVQVATLADNATRDQESGKMTIIGCYDQLRFPAVPASIVTAVALKFRPAPNEVGVALPLALRMIDPDGQSIDLIPTTTITPTHTDDGAPAEIPVPFVMDGLTFHKFGSHRIDIIVAGKVIGDIEVHVLRQ